MPATQRHPALGRDDKRVREFIRAVGPQVRDFIDSQPGCIVGIRTGGSPYAMELLLDLQREGVDVSYIDYEKGTDPRNYAQQLRGRRRVVIVDDAIATTRTYRETMELFKSAKDELGIEEVRYAVEHDMTNGSADFAPKETFGSLARRLFSSLHIL